MTGPLEVYATTLRQFREAAVRESAGSCGVTQAEVLRCTPPGAPIWGDLWRAELRAAARDGRVLHRRVLDALHPVQRRSLLHDYPGCAPAGYVWPEARPARGTRR